MQTTILWLLVGCLLLAFCILVALYLLFGLLFCCFSFQWASRQRHLDCFFCYFVCALFPLLAVPVDSRTGQSWSACLSNCLSVCLSFVLSHRLLKLMPMQVPFNARLAHIRIRVAPFKRMVTASLPLCLRRCSCTLVVLGLVWPCVYLFCWLVSVRPSSISVIMGTHRGLPRE